VDLLRHVVVVLALLCGARAEAQLASPGPLAKPHARLEGLSNCVKCHPAGKQLSPDTCLACHTELERRIKNGRGFHGHMPSGTRASCNSCHRDHEGRDFALIDWMPSKERFDHDKTGWPLRGKHAGEKCTTCHEPRRTVDADAQALRKRGADTMLGIGTACITCHFDEHRGQVATRDCQRCHGESAWKPAHFDHDKSAYPLRGKHAQVTCQKCHPTLADEQKHPFPPARSTRYTQLTGLDHDRCVDCHNDPHDGRFGETCESCHTVDGWAAPARKKEERAFHERTRYPLRGLHASVACDACHRPSRGKPARFKGLPFAACRDCHVDAHGGQLADPACERCHTVDGFRPSLFELEDHQKTAYKLEGAHAAVACTACHSKFGRGQRASNSKLASIVLRMPGQGDKCERCHADPHAGQLAQGCTSCHDLDSFHKPRFDHGKTRMPLTGVHGKLACAACHQKQRVGDDEIVRYRPISPACATCHADVHVGQFAGTRCEECHEAVEWKRTKFRHDDKRFTDYRLEGRHAKVACGRCHTKVVVADGKVQRFRPLPRACATCHADFHKGDFRNLPVTVLGAARSEISASGAVRCDLCHRTQGWDEVAFPHERTGFPLNGMHRRVTCRACHTANYQKHVSVQCAGCHRDPHAAEFGKRCEGCHEEESWRSRFDVSAHRATNFPLAGRHALIPCVECHPNARDRGFARAATQCLSCHQGDYDRAGTLSVDHAKNGFTTECRACHNSMRWKPARYPSHDRCFRIGTGPHAGIRCEGCHTTIPQPSSLSSCTSNNAACTSCHTHDKSRTDAVHAQRGVAGYSYQDRKCYECHTGA
jgi:hypothetical protein